MTGASGVRTCPACGSAAISSQRRTLDPVTGKSTTPPLTGVVVWGLLALCGVIMLLLLAIELIGPHPSNVSFGSLDLLIVGLSVFAIVTFWAQLRRFRGRGPGGGHVYSCRDCANEWFVADRRLLVRTVPRAQRQPPRRPRHNHRLPRSQAHQLSRRKHRREPLRHPSMCLQASRGSWQP